MNTSGKSLLFLAACVAAATTFAGCGSKATAQPDPEPSASTATVDIDVPPRVLNRTDHPIATKRDASGRLVCSSKTVAEVSFEGYLTQDVTIGNNKLEVHWTPDGVNVVGDPTVIVSLVQSMVVNHSVGGNVPKDFAVRQLSSDGLVMPSKFYGTPSSLTLCGGTVAA